jgi:hypothetical protein
MYGPRAPTTYDTGGNIYQLLALYNRFNQQQAPQYSMSGPQINPLQAYALYSKLAGGGAGGAAAPIEGGMTGVTAAPAAGSAGLSGAALAGAVAAPFIGSAIWAGKDILGKKDENSGNAFYKLLKGLGF